MGIRCSVHVGAALAAVTACFLAPLPAQAQHSLDYVALGDSAAAGPFTGQPDPNLLCARSTANYPHVAAERLGARLTDRTCSSADIADLAGRQYGLLPPQYDALSDRTGLITITIGGNDVRLVEAAAACLNVFPEPYGLSCADRYTADGRDELAARIDRMAPDFDAALGEIRHRAPNAAIVVVGYGTYLPHGGCFPRQPIWARDADYIQGTVDRLSATLARIAKQHGSMFVDIGRLSQGHDACAAPRDKYFEGFVPSSFAAPMHPNVRGMAAIGHAVAGAVIADVPHRFQKRSRREASAQPETAPTPH